MSEEILKALMQLFALITKQDGGIGEKETAYVHRFLVQQIGVESAGEYLELYKQTAEADELVPDKGGLTSVLDSVRVLKLCKQISKTINQRQKVVVLVRILELINAEYKLTDQRLGIVKTVSDIFRIQKEEYDTIFSFVTFGDPGSLTHENHLLMGGAEEPGEGLDAPLLFLRVPSVELYFLKYSGEQELLLNGLTVRPGVIYLFASGSTLRLPVGRPVYYSDVSARFMAGRSVEEITLESEEISYRFPGGVTGLRNISFSAHQGNLVGILGSSGSGKTTLLNVLAGIYRPASGHVQINGLDLTRDEEELAGVTGYVPQDDLLIEELTVFDNLYYASKLCFSNLSDSEIREKVSGTLASLGLNEKAHLRVGSVMDKTISGGQRKRLNIALELIREPSVLFLDEPTSGLSSRDSENVMDLLRELTIRGKLVFVVIHQPSSELYKMFDRVVILDSGGRMVFYGNPVEAVIHFKKADNQVNAGVGECPVCGNVNPEMIFNIIEARKVDEYGNYTAQRKVHPETWEKIFHEEHPVEKADPPESPPPSNLAVPGWFSQLFNYLRRDLKTKISNRQYLLLILLVSPVLAFILAYIIRYIADPTSQTYVFRENENIPIYIFMALIVALFLGLIISAEEIFRDRKILKREKFLHLSRSSYLLAKTGTLALISGVQAILFVLVANQILEIRHMTFPYWMALFTTAVCANMIGLVISSAFSSAVAIYIAIPLVMIPMMVLSGAMFSFEKLNRRITTVGKVPLVAELMPTKWSYEALMVHQFKDNEFEKNFYGYDKRISYHNFRAAYLVPELEERLNRCLEEYREAGVVDAATDALRVLENEITEAGPRVEDIRFSKREWSPEAFDEKLADKAGRFLDALKQYHIYRFSVANREKERYLNRLMRDRRQLYFTMLDRYHNEAVADHVKKIYEKNQIVEYQGRLYQQIDPVFLDPDPEGIGIRSHFYAPRKYVAGRYVDTFTFNMGFIWLLTILWYVVLYYDIAGRLVRTRIFRPGSRRKDFDNS